MSILRELVKSKSGVKVERLKLKYNHLRKTRVDIHQIAEHMEGKIIDNVDVVYGEDTIVLYLEDGSDVELVLDSIYLNVPATDD